MKVKEAKRATTRLQHRHKTHIESQTEDVCDDLAGALCMVTTYNSASVKFVWSTQDRQGITVRSFM